MPNRPGLKFPSRDFGRISSKTLSAVPLSPKPSLPRSRADSPRAASPAVEAPAAEAEAESEAEPADSPLPTAEEEEVVIEEAESEAVESDPLPTASSMPAEEAVSQPEPRRLPHSRFTEEYLRPIVPNRHLEPVRAQPEQAPRAVLVVAETGTQSSEPSYSDEATETAQPSEAVTIETQTSILAVAEEPEPMHGFRRHMSLREPDTLLHPRLGRPTADDMITTAQPHMAPPQRRATTDFMLDDAVEQEAEAVAAEAASQPSAEGDQYDSDLVTDLVKSLSSAAADNYEEDQDAAVAEIAAGLQSAAADDFSRDADMAVDSALERVATDVDGYFSANATAVVDHTISSLSQDADAHADLEQSQAIESTLVSVTLAAATADAADQAEAVDAAVSHLANHVTNDYTAEQHVTADAVVTSLTEEAEAADNAEQLAAVATVVDSLRAQSAEHYEQSDSLAVAEALGGLQTAATDHYSSQAAATADEAVSDLASEALRAFDAEQTAIAGESSASLLCNCIFALLYLLVCILYTALLMISSDAPSVGLIFIEAAYKPEMRSAVQHVMHKPSTCQHNLLLEHVTENLDLHSSPCQI